MAATDNDALLKAMDQLMKEEDRASVIEYAKQLSTKGGDVVGTMRKMSQQGVDTKKEAAMWKKRALLTAAVAVVVCAVMFGLMVASAEFTKESHVSTPQSTGSGRNLQNAGQAGGPAEYKDGWVVQNGSPVDLKEGKFFTDGSTRNRRLDPAEVKEAKKVMLSQSQGVLIVTEGEVRRLGEEDGRELESYSLGLKFDKTTGGIYDSITTERRLGADGTRRLTGVDETFCLQGMSGKSYTSTNGGDFEESATSCQGRRLEAQEDGRELMQVSAGAVVSCDCNADAATPCVIPCGTF